MLQTILVYKTQERYKILTKMDLFCKTVIQCSLQEKICTRAREIKPICLCDIFLYFYFFEFQWKRSRIWVYFSLYILYVLSLPGINVYRFQRFLQFTLANGTVDITHAWSS